MAIAELVDTERSYVAALRAILEGYVVAAGSCVVGGCAHACFCAFERVCLCALYACVVGGQTA